MKFTKTLGEILFDLYGPNGCDQTTSTRDARRIAVYAELERHGLVKIEKVPTSDYESMRFIRRTHPAFSAGKTLCEALTNP